MIGTRFFCLKMGTVVSRIPCSGYYYSYSEQAEARSPDSTECDL